MNTLEQLSLEAFQVALNRLEEPLPAALAKQVQYFSENWAAHIGELRELTEQFEPLKTHYKAARLELQSQSADRKQFLENEFQVDKGKPNNTDGSSTDARRAPHHDFQLAARLEREPEQVAESVVVLPVSTPLAESRILKALERSRLTAQELICTLNQPPQQTQEILHTLWQKGYIEELSASLLHIVFPRLRSPQYRNHFPAPDTILTLTSRGYFSLYPFMTRNKRMVSA